MRSLNFSINLILPAAPLGSIHLVGIWPVLVSYGHDNVTAGSMKDGNFA
jgi:hypothetical protein